MLFLSNSAAIQLTTAATATWSWYLTLAIHTLHGTGEREMKQLMCPLSSLLACSLPASVFVQPSHPFCFFFFFFLFCESELKLSFTRLSGEHSRSFLSPSEKWVQRGRKKKKNVRLLHPGPQGRSASFPRALTWVSFSSSPSSSLLLLLPLLPLLPPRLLLLLLLLSHYRHFTRHKSTSSPSLLLLPPFSLWFTSFSKNSSFLHSHQMTFASATRLSSSFRPREHPVHSVTSLTCSLLLSSLLPDRWRLSSGLFA